MVDRPDPQPKAEDGRPALGFRVGVTGHRKLDAGAIAGIEQAVGRIASDIEQILIEVSREPAARNLYTDGTPVVRMISPLAEGADRLVARIALARGWRLAAPLPFARDEYERDFPDSVAEFRELLTPAETAGQVVELDGGRDRETAAYLQVGRFVVNHSDILIAIWDGKPPAGEGGTGQIVQEALAAGVLSIHVGVHAPHQILLLSDGDDPAPYDRTQLEPLVRRLVLPEWRTGRRNHDRAVAVYLRRERARYSGVAPDFLYRGPFAAKTLWFERLFPAFVRLIGGTVSSAEKVVAAGPPAGADNPVVRALYLHYQRADALATHYAEVHRSAFMLVYIFGAASLAAAFAALFLHRLSDPSWLRLAAAFEFVCLAAIFLAVRLEGHYRWRERWLDYRLLAETLREADLLAQLGGIPPVGSLDRMNDFHPERGWIPWLVGAIGRSVGVVGGRYDSDYLARVRDYAAKTRLTDQIAYHERTEKRNANVSHRLTWFSRGLFLVTFVPVVAEFFWSEFAVFGLLAGLFPAIAAVSFGIRNQAEFEIVVHRSARLREALSRERARFDGLVGEAMTSAAVGHAIRRGARIMQRDTLEWAEIFEVKESDVG